MDSELFTDSYFCNYSKEYSYKQIICQDAVDDNSSTAHGVPDQHGTELLSGEAGDHMAERDNAHEDNENSDTHVVTEDGQGRETVGRRSPAVDSAYYDAAEGDETLPPRSKASKGQTSPCSDHGIHYEERYKKPIITCQN